MNNRKKLLLRLAVVVMAVLSFGGVGRVAAASVDEVYNNIMLNAMQKCYAPLAMSTEIDLMEYRRDGNTAEGAFGNYVLSGSADTANIYLPTGVGNNIKAFADKTTTLSCRQLFLGDSSVGLDNGVFSKFGKALPNPASDNVGEELGNVGYTLSESGSANQICVTGEYTVRGGSARSSAGKVCWESSETATGGDLASRGIVTPGADGARLDPKVWADPINGFKRTYVGFIDPAGKTCDLVGHYFTSVDGINMNGATCSTEGYTITLSLGEEMNIGNAYGTRKIQNFNTAYSTARNYFGGSGSLHDFTTEEKYTLYYEYLNKIYGMRDTDGTCKTRAELAAMGGPIQSDGSYYVYENGLYYRKDFPSANADLRVMAFGSDKNFLVGYNVLSQIVESIYNFNLPEEGTCGEEDDDSGGGGPGIDESNDIVDCNKLQDIGAMQWILCPVANNTQRSVNLVDEQVDDMLSIDTSLYSGNAVETVWKSIRAIANVLMIVFMLVILFSQITGYGIDNYGIKKMLPRLIVMAIVVNLSFYICQIAVDLSNILGVGLRGLFEQVGGSLGNVDLGELSFTGGMITAIFAAAGGLTTGVAAGASIFALTGFGIVGALIGVLVALLVIVVALFTIFLMIGIRKIIVIACVILSPLAFTAYILPNTKGMFSKWWDLFKAALIIYPICGVFLGISKVLKALSLQGDASGKLGVGGGLVMMVLPYVGFFLIPMLLKNALAALGKLGGALTSLGSTIQRGGRQLGQTGMNMAKNTEAYKNLQSDASRRRQEQNAQRTIKKLQQIRDNGGELTDAQTRRLARASETRRKLANEDIAARTILAENEYAGMRLGDANDRWDDNDDKTHTLMAAWNRARENGNTNELTALTNVITSRSGPGGVNTMASAMADWQVFDGNGEFIGGEDGNTARSFNALATNLTQNSAFSNAMQSKASDVYQMLSSGGYVKQKASDGTETNVRANLNSHAANNAIATQNKDWATQSNGTLQRAAANGGIDADRARSLLESTDAAIQSGIQSDKGKRQTLEAIASGQSVDWSNKDSIAQAADSYRARQAQVQGGMSAQYVGRSANDTYGEAMAENASRAANLETRMQDFSTMSASALQNKIQSGEISRQMAHDMLTSSNQTVQRQLSGDANADKRAILEAAASGMMPTASNPTPNLPGGGQLDWGNAADIDRAAQSYRTQAAGMDSGYVARDAALVQGEAMAENARRTRETAERQAEQRKHDELVGEMKRVANAVERLNNNRGGDNNSGQGFDQGAGI